ncbi:response regulator [Rhodonellum sp.]|uniref:ATP-binding response regulator n=1 Tax=Rhodonellum sp. TaxID=2231180 RepID=UPI0027241375|nr:response regulator [Rhodonellum sp.]MDO9554929.1 response regulator [Rhodonellum sp.]
MKEKILLIEDEIELQQNLKEILEYHGFSVLTAENGIEALFKIKNQDVDLILCDIMMPEMDGFQFIEIFRAEKKNQHTPFIFLSAKVSAEDKAIGLQEGADDYLTKPISARLLLNAIFAALDKKNERILWSSLMNEKEEGIEHSHSLSKTTSPISLLLNVLGKLKTATVPMEVNEVSQLVNLAFTSAKWIHSSFTKTPLFTNLGKLQPKPSSINLGDLVLDTLNEFGKESFLAHTAMTQNIVFDPEQIQFIIRELLENSLKFKSDSNKVQVEWFGNELSVKNQQTILIQTEEIPITAFAQPSGGVHERRGLGLGLFLCKEYCRINKAKLSCSVNAEGNFIAKIIFPNAGNAMED